jgi:hypothetical protein
MCSDIQTLSLKKIDDPVMIREFFAHEDISGPLSNDMGDDYNYIDSDTDYLGAYVNDELAGIFRVKSASKLNDKAHFAIRKHQLAHIREFCVKCIDWIFTENKAHRITLEIPDCWRERVNMALKLGFKYEGKARESYMKDGVMLDTHILGLLKEEYYGRR